MDVIRPVAETRRDRFSALATEVYEPLQRYVRRRVLPDDVDDVVADAMATLWRRIDDVPDTARLPWAYAVARRHVANHRRAGERRLRLVHRAEAQPRLPHDDAGPLDAELATALGRLDPAERELVRLWAWEQLDPAEIAVVLGMTANAVSIRLHRVKKKLGGFLEEARKDGAASGHIPVERRKEGRP